MSNSKQLSTCVTDYHILMNCNIKVVIIIIIIKTSIIINIIIIINKVTEHYLFLTSDLKLLLC